MTDRNGGIPEVPFLFLMEIIVLYKGFNAMSEGIQVASTPFRVSSICPSAFSTFSGVIS
ncbi:hypothetical protein [Phocaeicola coprocola]|uniref:hypothetical protein n=1 Tax=Phocaeicola coprocola TaxID=310298 RepID=UPI002943AA1E|nr:hypothetical protein [Phocaeicola coprocola]